MYRYNTAVQESEKHIPFELMFKWMTIVSVNINTTGNYNPDNMIKKQF